jgi:hypothetical protein
MDKSVMLRLLAMEFEIVQPLHAKHHDAPVLAPPALKQGSSLFSRFEAAPDRSVGHLSGRFPLTHRQVLSDQHSKGSGIR